MKENTPVKVMCAMYGCPHMIDFANYVDQLRMDQEPDYDYLKFLLKKNLLDKDIVPRQYIEKTQSDGDATCSSTQYVKSYENDNIIRLHTHDMD